MYTGMRMHKPHGAPLARPHPTPKSTLQVQNLPTFGEITLKNTTKQSVCQTHFWQQ